MVYNEESLISVVFRDQSIQCFRDYIMMGLLTYLRSGGRSLARSKTAAGFNADIATYRWPTTGAVKSTLVARAYSNSIKLELCF